MRQSLLVFTGTKFPALDIYRGSGFVGAEPIAFGARGAGRRYEVSGPGAWWRDLAELDLNSAEAVGRFVMRRGDPSGRLDRQMPASTHDFKDIVRGLGTIAAAWTPAGEDGLSHCDAAQVEAAQKALTALASALPSDRSSTDLAGGVSHLDVVIDKQAPLGLAIRARTLAGYLFASASHCLIERVSMRRCRHCASWFEASNRRIDAGFCSGSCRTMFYKPTAAGQPQQEET